MTFTERLPIKNKVMLVFSKCNYVTLFMRGCIEENSPPDKNPLTFTRKVTTNLIRAISSIKKVIDDDNLDFLSKDKGPLISSNFCDALMEMRPTSANSNLEVDVKFSTKDVIPDVSRNISLRSDYFPEIEQIGRSLRPDRKTETQTIFAKVDACNGEPNEDGQMEGEVTLVFISEDTKTKAKISLNAEQYQYAVNAHKDNKYIKVHGEYRPSTRIGQIVKHTVFTLQEE